MAPTPRRLLLEPLAARRLLVGDWQNPFNRADVNDDGLVAPVDGLFVINRINSQGSGPLPIPPPVPGGPPPYVDTSGDDLLTAVDALIIFNLLNSDRSPPVLNVGLANDTAPGGGTNDDRITSDDTTAGNVDDPTGIQSLVFVDGAIRRPVPFDFRTGDFMFDPGFAADGSDDGPQNLRFEAVDARGNGPTVTVLSITLDTQSPLLTVGLVNDTAPGGGTNNDRITSDPAMTGRVTDMSAIASLRAELNGNSLGDVAFDAMGNFTVPHGLAVDGSDDGQHTIRLLAEDLAGNVSEVTFMLQLDTRPPDLTARLSSDTAPGGGTNDDRVTSVDDTRGTATDAGSGLVQFQARLDGGQAQNVAVTGGMFTFDPALAADGSDDGGHQVEYLAVDAAGNVAATTLAFTLDTQSPAITLGLVNDTAPGGGTNSDLVTFDPAAAGRTTDLSTIVSLRAELNGNSLGDVAFDAMGNFTVPHGLAVDGSDDGLHTIRMLAEDLAGNPSQMLLTFRLDTRPPDLTARLSNDTAPGGGTNDDRVTSVDDTRGTATDAGSGLLQLQARVDSGSLQNVTVASGMFTFDPGLANDGSADGGHQIDYQAVDVAGNVAATTLAFTLDTQAPQINAGLVNDTAPRNTTNSDGVTFDARLAGSVVTALPGIALFQASLDGGTAVNVALDGGNNFSFDPGLQAGGANDGPHMVRFTVADTAGNTRMRDVAFTLDTVAPSEPTLVLDPAFVFGPPEDGLTRDASVTLRGTSQPQSLLELLPTMRLTTADGAGSYSFGGVPLQLGENDLTVTAYDTAGNSRGTARTITRLDADVVAYLQERSRFATEMSLLIDLALAAGSRQVRFDVESMFDTSDTSSVGGDALLVYLVDPDDRQTLLASGGPGTSLFAWREGAVEFRPGLVNFDGRTVEIEVSQLGHLEQGLLVFQLLNNDTDTGTQFVVRRLVNEVDPEGVVSPIFPPPPQLAPLGGGLANLDSFQASASVEVRLSNSRFEPDSGTYRAELRVANTGPGTDRRVAVVFPGLPAGVTLVNATGTTSSGAPYLDLSQAIGSGGLGPDAVSQGVLVEFQLASGNNFPLQPQVLVGGLNRPPQFDPPANLQVFPGGYLEQVLEAIDPDGDSITYSIRADGLLPANMLLADGMFVVTPAPGDIGAYNLTLIASDGVLETSREIMLQVPLDPVMSTRVRGQVLDVDMNPLAGVPIELGEDSTVTDPGGGFELQLTTPMPQAPLEIHGELFVGPDDYPFVAEDLALLLNRPFFTGVNNVLPRPIYLPRLDTENGTPIDPMNDTVVSTPMIPDAELLVPAGSLLDPQGQLFTGEVSITEVPTDRTPAALPPGQAPDILVTIQPAEMQFTTPAPLTLPNLTGYAPGTELDLYSINPQTGQFDIVGNGQVTPDGRAVRTVTGGVRNSSWHFFSPPPTVPTDLASNVRNRANCGSCEERIEANAQVELHSGVLLEHHPLVANQTLGVTRGLTLVYDSLRADPRPILHFGYDAVPDDAALRMVASLSVRREGFELQVPGRPSQDVGLTGNEHFWSIPAGGGDIEAALQADLATQPTGRYTYQLLSGLLRLQDGRFNGSRITSTADLAHVNTIDSIFGAGWGLAGLQQLHEDSAGWVLLVDGDGSELLFRPGSQPGQYVSPVGDFSRLEKLGDDTFRRTLKDQTVYAFDAGNRLESIADRHGNVTAFAYDGSGNLLTITDQVGRVTMFGYTGGKVSSITDPAGRTTMLMHDGDGNLASVRDPDTSQRLFDYDDRHLLVEETNKRGFRETKVYDFAGRLERSLTEDGAEIQVEPLQVQELLPPARTRNLSQPPVAFPTSAPLAFHTDANGNTFATELDQLGQRVFSFDGEGIGERIVRNASNLITSITDPRGFTTRYTYDALGNLLSVFDAGLSGGASLDSPFDLGLLQADRTLQAHVGSLDRTDFFRLELDTASRLSVRLDELNEETIVSIIGDFNGDFLVDSGEVVETVTSNGSEPLLLVEELSAGVWYVRIEADTFPVGENSAYRMELTSEPLVLTTPADPGQTLGEALDVGTLSVEQRFQDWVGGTDTRDYYRFQIAQNGTPVWVRLSELRENADLQLIRDANGNGVVDFGDVLDSSTASGTGSEQIFATLAAGTYFVSVLPTTFPVGENTSYTLDLAVVQTPATTPHVDNGNSLGTAMDIGSLAGPAAYSGSIGGSDTHDFFRFTISENVRLRGQLTGLSADARVGLVADIDGNLTIATRELIAFSQRSNTAAPEWFDEEIGPGTYYLVVYQEQFDARLNTDYLVELLPTSAPTLDPEAGESFATALSIDPFTGPQTFRDNVGSLDRFDYYAFTLSQSSTVRARLTELEEDIALGLAADINGNGLLDSNEIVERGAMEGKVDEWLEEQLTPGTWYFVVLQNDFQENNNSHYRLDVDLIVVETDPLADPGQDYPTALDIGPLAESRSFRQSVGSVDTHDFYKFTLSEASTVSVRLGELNEDLQLGLAADLNGNGTFVSTELIEQTTYAGKHPEWLSEQLAPGEYYLVVFQGQFQRDQNSHYLLEVDVARADTTTASDPGNTLATAMPIAPSNRPLVIRENVGSIDRRDFYSFTLTEPGTITAQLNGLSEDLQLALAVDANNDGNHETIELSSAPGAEREWIDEQVPPGTYYILVFQGDFQTDQNSHYELEVRLDAAPPTTPSDPGATLATALVLDPFDGPRTYRNTAGTLDRRDFYRFTLAAPATVTAELDQLDEDLQLGLVVDLTGNGYDDADLIETSTGVGRAREWLSQELPAGTYYFVVYQGNFQETENSHYQLNLNVTPLADVRGTDPGNRPGDAAILGMLASDMVVRDVAGTLDTDDYYQFTLSSAQTVELLLRDLDESLELGLVFDANGNGNLDFGDQIATSTNAGRAIDWIQADLAAGTYYARVYQGQFTRGENSHYELQLRLPVAPSANPADPGGTLAAARPLGTLTGVISRTDFVGTSDPHDYYQLVLSEARELRLALTGLSADADIRLIADRNGNLAIDSGDVIEEVNSSGSSPAFLHEDLGPGTYYIHVFQPTFPANQNTDYNLEITSTLLPVDPVVDPGGTLAAALNLGPLSSPQSFRDAIGSLDTLDFYRFQLSRDSQVKLRLEGMMEAAELAIVADENSDGVVQSSEVLEVAESADTVLLTEFLPAGVYYVRVGQVSFPAGENTRYRLVAEAVPLPATTLVEPGQLLPAALNIGTLLPGTLTGQQRFQQTVGNLDRADIYRFQLNEDLELRVQLRDVAEETVVSLIADLDGDLAIDSGETIETVTSLGGVTTLLTEYLPAGTYYLSIAPDTFPAGQNSNYTLEIGVQGVDESPASDPGNTLSEAFELGALGEPLSLRQTIGSLDPDDFYRFDLAGVREVLVRMDGLSEEVIVSLVADVNNNGAVDTGETIETVTSSGFDVLLHEVLGPGSYFLRVQPDTFPAGQNTSYNLQLVSRAISDSFGPRTFTYDPVFSQLTSEKDELGRLTLYDVDPANGNIIRETRVVGLRDAISGETDDLVTEFTYTPEGRINTVTDPLGRVADHDYDPLGRLMRITYAQGTADEADQQFEYDAAGNVTAVIDENLNRTEFLYDDMNRLVMLTEADPDAAGPLVSPVTMYDYDLAGNLIGITDPLNNSTTIAYDLKNRPESRRDAQLNDTLLVHDLAGNLSRSEDELGAATSNRYDERNRLIETVDPNGGTTRYRYDASDNLIRVTDPLGNITRYQYDHQNRLERVIDPLGNEARYQYDAVGNRLATLDRNDRRTEFSFDDLDRLVRETWRAADGTVENVVQYTYDGAGNLLTAVDDFSQLTFTYDDRNRLLTASNAGTAGAPEVVLSYSYDAAGNVLAIADQIAAAPAGTTSFLVDGLHRTTSILQGGTGVAAKRVDLVYDALGQLESLVRFSDHAGTMPVVTTTWSYDSLGRLDTLVHNDGLVDVAVYDYDRDAAGRVIRLTDGTGIADYEYDAGGQLLDLAHSVREDESFVYDAGGNRTESSLHDADYVIDPGNRLRTDGTYNYTYDDEGNVIRRTEIATGDYVELEYDHRNRLRAVIERDSGGGEQGRIEYRYDVLNRRIVTHLSDGGETTEYFIYDRDALHLEFTDNDGNGPNLPALESRFLNGPAVDQVLAEEGGGQVGWLLADGLGSVREIVDNDGDVINAIVYGAFGQVVSESNPAIDTRHRFAGRVLDRETGLYYFEARYYDPLLGRFLSEDPLGQAAGDTNLATYAFNDPVNLRDPSGRIVAHLSISSETLRSLAFSRLVVAGGLDVQVEQFTRDPAGRVDPLALFNRTTLAASARPRCGIRWPWPIAPRSICRPGRSLGRPRPVCNRSLINRYRAPASYCAARPRSWLRAACHERLSNGRFRPRASSVRTWPEVPACRWGL
ncbi:MAG: pre-peptidase C-terminal domain-containing protein [Pirellulaceae bacterium]|nr:pre-peptidase C-terminal domain-containing protein [Pirellulaceae bacterium]